MRPSTSEFYRLNAVRCVDIAWHGMDADHKATLLAMAQSWLRLADHAAENTQASMISFTRRRSRKISLDADLDLRGKGARVRQFYVIYPAIVREGPNAG